MEINDYLVVIETSLNMKLTEEQKAFIRDAPLHNVFSMSVAGSGKTTTAVLAVNAATDVFKIQPEKINVMSFTNASTSDIKYRYEKFRKQLGVSIKNVNFRTLDSMIYAIANEYSGVVGMKKLSKINIMQKDDLFKLREDIINKFLEDKTGEDLSDDSSGLIMSKIMKCLTELNTKFRYTKEEIETSQTFIELQGSIELSIDTINEIRQIEYRCMKIISNIAQEYLAILAYEILKTNSKVGKYYKELYEFMIVDEVQDMSSIQLLILNEIANRIVAIGDVNQQIYNFRGASNNTIELLYELYPDIRERNLTVSYRCTEEVANLARNVIRPNNTNGESIQTLKTGPYPDIVKEDLMTFTDRIINVYRENEDASVIITYRNKFTLASVIDIMYKAGLKVRCAKYESILEMYRIKDIFELIKFIEDPTQYELTPILNKFIPGLSIQTLRELTKQCMFQKTTINKISIDMPAINDKLNRLFTAWNNVEYNIIMNDQIYPIFETLLSAYYKNGLNKYLNYTGQKIDNILYYAKTTMGDMTIKEFIKYETQKSLTIRDNVKRLIGCNLSTMHSVKGLEAENVFILDCESSILPSKKDIKILKESKNYEELNKYIRNERSLLYVAITRSSKNLTIQYEDELSELISNPLSNEYNFDIHDINRETLNDKLKVFKEFMQKSKLD